VSHHTQQLFSKSSPQKLQSLTQHTVI